ncbi:MAG: hypothetical protein AAF628_33585 [Planctomycetota bacterium]
MSVAAPRSRFGWPHTEARLRQLMALGPVAREPDTQAFVLRAPDGAVRARLVPPAVQPVGPLVENAADYLETLCLGRITVVLLRAGRAALGVWTDAGLVRHKVITKYVVRGRGRAQPTHLRIKGKSSPGSRLRLRNATSLLRDVNQKLHEWWREEGPSGRVFYACPVRLWAEVFRADPTPPFPWDEPLRVGTHVHAPSHRELLRVWHHLSRGELTHYPIP